MKKIITSLITTAVTLIQLSSQVCTGCSQTITTNSFTPIITGPGDKICITSSGIINAPITMNGGEICNEGIINGSVTTSSGVLNNFGTINASVLNLGGDHIFNNNNIVNVASTYSASDSVEFYNNGGMMVGSNFTNNNISVYYTHCMVMVNGNWANYGVIVGPTTGCGGFSVIGTASNYGFFGTDLGYLDMCDSANVGSFTAQSGTLGLNVTFCACTDFCSTTIGVEENTNNNNAMVTIFPNPASNHLILSIETMPTLPYDIYIYNGLGIIKRVISNNIVNQINISREDLPLGIYYYSVISQQTMLAQGKIVFN